MTSASPSSAGIHGKGDSVLFDHAIARVVEEDIASLKEVVVGSSSTVVVVVVDSRVVEVEDVVDVLFTEVIVVEDAGLITSSTVTSIFLEIPPYSASALYFPGVKGMKVYSSFRSGMSLEPVHMQAAKA